MANQLWISDLVFEVWKQGESRSCRAAHVTLIFEVKASGQLRWARLASDQLSRYIEQVIEHGHSPVYGLLVAPYVSDAAAEIPQKRGHG